jgi:hypothetical protein
MLRLIVSGSRAWDRPAYVRSVLDGLLLAHGEMVLYLGMCPDGTDAASHAWYLDRQAAGASVALAAFAVDVTLDGPWPAAGQRRNVRMVHSFAADVAGGGRRDAAEVHGFLRGRSPGTRGCLEAARRAGFQPTVHRYEAVIPRG